MIIFWTVFRGPIRLQAHKPGGEGSGTPRSDQQSQANKEADGLGSSVKKKQIKKELNKIHPSGGLFRKMAIDERLVAQHQNKTNHQHQTGLGENQ